MSLLTDIPTLTKNNASLSCSFKAHYSSGPSPNYTAPPGGTKVIRVPPFDVVVFMKCNQCIVNGTQYDGFQGEHFVAQTMDIPTATAIEGTVTLLSPINSPESIRYIGTALILQQTRMQNSETTGAFESYEFGDVDIGVP